MNECIVKLKKYIEEHFLEDLSLDEIANVAGYSKFHLERMFLDETGLTVHKYIMERRLSEAASLLINTEQPIAQIALEVGYTSQQSFTLAFKKMYQTTPNQYRNEVVPVVTTKIVYLEDKKKSMYHLMKLLLKEVNQEKVVA